MAADKRSLYHLAPTQSPSPQFRKPLAQGRLEKSPLHGSLQIEQKQTSKIGYIPFEHTPKATPTKSEESPRLTAPAQYKEPGDSRPLLSPKAVEPSSSLSLSENDDSTEPIRSDKILTSKTEVPIVTNTVTSPVKVVCHSPRRSKTKGREGNGEEEVRGYADQANRVNVPSVKKIPIKHLDGQDRQPIVTHDGSLSEDSVDNIKMIAGSPVDPNSLAVQVELDDNDNGEAPQQIQYNPNQYKSFMGDDQVHVTGPLTAGLNQSNVRQQLFDFSVTSVDSSVMENGTAGSVSVTDDKKKKEKKAGRIIPSRYMASTKATKPVKKTTSSHSKSKVTFGNTSKNHSTHNKSAQLNVTAQSQTNTSLKRSKVVTSTPAVGSMGILPAHPGGDMTAPTPILPPGQSATRAKTRGVSPHVRGDEKKRKPPTEMKAPLLPQKHIDNITKHKEQEIGEISQEQLELEYARMLQWAFLVSKLESTLKVQEKEAQVQLYSKWQENEKLRREISELQLELDTRSKITELDEQIGLQLSGLKPISDNITKQLQHYEQLSSGLNATCQYMPVSGVTVDNKEELLVALSESERLLGEIDSLTRHRNKKITSFSHDMDVLSKVTDNEVQEQARCQELLAAASTIGTQERSLLGHDIQLSKPLNSPSDDNSL